MADSLARCAVCEVTGEPLVARADGSLACEDNDGCAARVNGLWTGAAPAPVRRADPVPLSLLPDELLRRAARVRDNRGARVAYQDAAWIVRKALAAASPGPRCTTCGHGRGDNELCSNAFHVRGPLHG